MAGVSLWKISQFLGHTTVRTTQIYAHLRPEDDEDIERF
jgi:site-specific recombinase XerD